MPTFLTNPKMNLALRARVAASVAGAGPRTTIRPMVVAAVRVAVAGILVTAVVLAVRQARTTRQKEATALADLQREREALIESIRRETSTLQPADLHYVTRVAGWVAHATGPYEGDMISPELRAMGGMAGLLGRPVTYVRALSVSFGHIDDVTRAALASPKDAFLACLADPPATREEKAMLSKVLATEASGPSIEDRTPNTRLLREVVIATPFLDSTWEETVRAARDADAVKEVRRLFERAQLPRAREALRAPYILYVLDEPNEPGGVTELDGEHVHWVRVGVIDATDAKPLFRLRRRVDPTWISESRRSKHAHTLDSCALAMDVRSTK